MYNEIFIKDLVDKEFKERGTSDPKELIDSRKKVTFSFLPMNDNINGLYIYVSENQQICSVNEYLEGYNREYALFHEYGHISLGHKGKPVFCSPSISDTKEEYEADLFATYAFVKRHGITRENVNELILPKRIKELIHKFL